MRQSLAQAHQTPASVPIPPAPSTQEVHTHYHAHQASLQPSVPSSSGTDPALIQLLRQGQSNSDARHNAQESYLQSVGLTLGNAVRHMQSNGAGFNSILHNLSQNRGQPTVEVPGRSNNSPPPPPPPGAGAIAIGGSSSSSVAAQLVGETSRQRSQKARSRSPSARRPASAVSAPDIPMAPSLPPPPPPPLPVPTIARKAAKKKAIVQTDTSKRGKSVPPMMDTSLPDHEPPAPSPPLPRHSRHQKQRLEP